MWRYTIVVIGLLIYNYGCAGESLRITYYSDPPGATLYTDGGTFGPTPVTVQYEPTEEFKSGGCMMLNTVSVRWVSGAAASIPSQKVCARNGESQHYLMDRPKGVAGLEVDMRYALEVEQVRLLREQAASIQRLQVFNPSYSPYAGLNALTQQRQLEQLQHNLMYHQQQLDQMRQ
jgi:hypothetical protein